MKIICARSPLGGIRIALAMGGAGQPLHLQLHQALGGDPDHFAQLDIALYRGESVAVAAVMEHRGVPIDMSIFPRLQDKRTWAFVRDAMVPAIDEQYGVYVKGKDGEWSFNMELFKGYLTRNGIDWPLLDTGKLDLRRKTFESMCKAYPALEDLRQLRYARDKMRRIKLAVGSDGRNRTVLWAFQAKTSRTQSKAAQWVFSPSVWLRSLIKPEPGRAVAYIDYSSMEFLIAAALSDRHCGPSNPMLDMYRSGDPYLSFAKRVSAAPRWATKTRTKACAIATRSDCWRSSMACRLKPLRCGSAFPRGRFPRYPRSRPWG